MKQSLIKKLAALTIILGLGGVSTWGQEPPPDDPPVDGEEEREGRGHKHNPCALFGLYDLNEDGKISQEEFMVVSEALVMDMQERLLSRYDANEDGVISPDESLAVHQSAIADRLVKILETYDADENGEVTEEEIQAALEDRIRAVRGGRNNRREGNRGGDRPQPRRRPAPRGGR